MFYSTNLLTKRGPLGKLWFAAHHPNKINKQHIVQTSIKAAVDSIKKPAQPLALRVCGHLLLGLSKIFQRQVTFLFLDSTDAFSRIKTALNPGAAKASIDVDDEGRGEGIDMRHGGGGAAGGTTLGVTAADLDDVDIGGLDEFAHLAAVLPTGDGSDWITMPSYGFGDGMPRERTEDDNSARRSASRSTVTGKSSVSDVEYHRRADTSGLGGGLGSVRGGSMSGDEDERGSVYSDRDDSVRGGKVRKSMLPGMEGALLHQSGRLPHSTSGLTTGEDVEDEEMAALMGYSGMGVGGGVGAGGKVMGPGGGDGLDMYTGPGAFDGYMSSFPPEYVEEEAEADHGMDGVVRVSTPSLHRGGGGLDDSEDSAPLATEELVMQGAGTKRAGGGRAEGAERKVKAAARKDRAPAPTSIPASGATQSTVVASGEMREWVNDASAIVRPGWAATTASRRSQHLTAIAHAAKAQAAAMVTAGAQWSINQGRGFITPTAQATSMLMAWHLSGPAMGPDGDATVAALDDAGALSLPATMLTVATGPMVHPDIAAVTLSHNTGPRRYPLLPSAAEAAGSGAAVVPATAASRRSRGSVKPVVEEEGHAMQVALDEWDPLAADLREEGDYAMGDHGVPGDGMGSMTADEWARLDAEAMGDMAASMGTKSGRLSSAVTAAKEEVDSSTVSSATAPGGEGEVEAGGITSVHMVEASKWDARTMAMLEVLAGEMTGPAVPVTGRKRKAMEVAGGAKYDLADVTTGKGTPSDPVSFFDLATGANRRTAVLSFYQLLTLRSWDIIHVQQSTPYDDILITRTPQFAQAVKDLNITV